MGNMHKKWGWKKSGFFEIKKSDFLIKWNFFI